MKMGTKRPLRKPISWKLFQKNLEKLAIIAFTFLLICAIAAPYAYSARKSKKNFKDFSGLHGRVTSITRFYPFELYDVSQNTFRDLSLEYLEITALSGKKRRLITLGSTEFILEDEVCLLFKPLSYGSILLKDLIGEEDPAVDILPLSHIRIAADGIIANLPFSHCLLCSDEKEKIYVVFLEKDKGRCQRWEDEQGIGYVRIEGDKGNYAEASFMEGCLETAGSGGCYAISYREY